MIEIISISLVAWWFTVGLGWIQYIKWRLGRKRLKPFDCPKCLAFWMGAWYGFGHLIFEQNSFISGIITGILCSVIAIIIEKLIARL